MKTAKEMFDSVMEKKDVQIAKAKARKALAWKVGAGVGCLALVCVLAFGLQKEPTAPTRDNAQMAGKPADTILQQPAAPTEAVKPQTKPKKDHPQPEVPEMKPEEPTVVAPDAKPEAEPEDMPAVQPTVKAEEVVQPVEKPTVAIVKPTAAPVVKPTVAIVVKPTETPAVQPTAAPVVKPTVAIVKPTVTIVQPTQPVFVTTPQQEPTQSAHYLVMLDVNPSIELKVGEGDKITEAVFGNKDGEKILAKAELTDMNVAEGVGVLMKEMVDQGYISQEANSVLVSVAGAEKEKADSVKTELTETINDTLSEKNVEGAIITQELSEEEAKKITVDGISPGKAKLIEQILAQNNLYTYEELAKMSIHQLNLLREEYYVNPEGVQISGAPSTLAYIGKDAAIRISQAAAQVIGEAEAELSCKSGVMVYIVEFENETHEYRYRINAVTGEILKAEESELGKNDFFQGDTPIATVGENAALAAALQHAGMENSKLIRCKYKTDWVDGKVIYDMYFTDGITSGSYVVNARTGEILKYSKGQEPRDRSVKVSVIGEAQAKAIAIAKDGLVDGNISKYEMNLRKDGDAYVYEQMFICNGVRYTAEIAAADGAVLSFERIVLSEVGKAPSAEADKTDKPAAESTKPSVEGEKPSAEEGNKPSAEEGNRPSAEEGDRPSAEEGDRPAAEEGNRPSAEEGDRPTAGECAKPIIPEGEKPSAEEGKNPSVES